MATGHRFDVGDEVVITRLFGSPLQRPFDRGTITQLISDSLYHYTVEHGGRLSFVCEPWLAPANYVISEGIEWDDFAVQT